MKLPLANCLFFEQCVTKNYTSSMKLSTKQFDIFLKFPYFFNQWRGEVLKRGKRKLQRVLLSGESGSIKSEQAQTSLKSLPSRIYRTPDGVRRTDNEKGKSK